MGAVHFYGLDSDGLVPGGPANKQGTFNIVFGANDPGQIAAEAGCTSHVFWQALDENRFVIAWYGRGTRIVDFKDPANPRGSARSSRAAPTPGRPSPTAASSSPATSPEAWTFPLHR